MIASCQQMRKKTDIEKEILNLIRNKTPQNSDMPTKVVKKNSDIFSSFLGSSFNSSIKESKLPSMS